MDGYDPSRAVDEGRRRGLEPYSRRRAVPVTTMSTWRLPQQEQNSRSPPFGNRGLSAVSLCLLGRIGLDLMAAISAPNDEANLGTGSVAERHRRTRLGFQNMTRVDFKSAPYVSCPTVLHIAARGRAALAALPPRDAFPRWPRWSASRGGNFRSVHRVARQGSCRRGDGIGHSSSPVAGITSHPASSRRISAPLTDLH